LILDLELDNAKLLAQVKNFEKLVVELKQQIETLNATAKDKQDESVQATQMYQTLLNKFEDSEAKVCTLGEENHCK
jgi:uncharacterized protein YlxW (UPF0749 family)